MSDIATEPTECPVCSSPDLQYWEKIETWVCKACSHVINDDSEIAVSSLSADLTATDNQPDVTSGHDWKREISVTDTSESILVDILSKTEETADEIGVSDTVMMQAAELVTEAWQSNFMHGRTREDTVAAAVYAASRQKEHAVPPGILANVVGSDTQSVKQTYISLKKEQQLDLEPPTPDEYIEYICYRLDVPDYVSEEAKATLAEQEVLSGNPIGIAAASVYEATKSETGITLQRTARTVALTKETVWRHATNLRSE